MYNSYSGIEEEREENIVEREFKEIVDREVIEVVDREVIEVGVNIKREIEVKRVSV